MEKGEKGLGSESCSLGLADSDDIDMRYWNGTILGPPHSTHENRIYSLSLEAGPDYPNKPPTVRFLSKINLPCVDQTTGVVDPSKLLCLNHWKRSYTMETVLVELRRYVPFIICLFQQKLTHLIIIIGIWLVLQIESYHNQLKEALIKLDLFIT